MHHLTRPKAFVFDLDGTLIDSRASIAAACNHALVIFGRAPQTIEAIGRMVGDGSRTLLERAFGAETSPAQIDHALAEFVTFYETHPTEGTGWMPHAQDLIKTLRARDLPVAIVTNKPFGVAERVLDAIGLKEIPLVGGGGGPLKPHPAPIFAAIEKLHAERDTTTWVVGDGVQDIEAARAAGCTSIAVLGGFTTEERLRDANPDAVLWSLEELASFVG